MARRGLEMISTGQLGCGWNGREILSPSVEATMGKHGAKRRGPGVGLDPSAQPHALSAGAGQSQPGIFKHVDKQGGVTFRDST